MVAGAMTDTPRAQAEPVAVYTFEPESTYRREAECLVVTGQLRITETDKVYLFTVGDLDTARREGAATQRAEDRLALDQIKHAKADQRAESIKAVKVLVSGPVIENVTWEQGVHAAIAALKAQEPSP